MNRAVQPPETPKKPAQSTRAARKRQTVGNLTSGDTNKATKSKKIKTSAAAAKGRHRQVAKQITTSAEFEENNNYVSMEVTGQLSDHFMSEDESDESANRSSQTLTSLDSKNSQSSAQRSRTPEDSSMQSSSLESDQTGSPSDEETTDSSETSKQDVVEPGTSKEGSMTDMLKLMQNFMMQKGLIKEPMNECQMRDFINEESRRDLNANRNNTGRD